MWSSIPNADLGLFERTKFDKYDLVVEDFGVLEHLRRGSKINGRLHNVLIELMKCS